MMGECDGLEQLPGKIGDECDDCWCLFATAGGASCFGGNACWMFNLDLKNFASCLGGRWSSIVVSVTVVG